MQAIPLHGKRGAGRFALVDDGDLPLVIGYRWHVYHKSNTDYARSWQGPPVNRHIRMHVLIMGQTGIDHIDADGLNNQRANLRPATQGQNCANERAIRGGSSQYKGVCWFAKNRRWKATIGIGKRMIHLGYFDDEIEAARAYDAAARELFGEYARPNFRE
jgi:hypothetical protein